MFDLEQAITEWRQRMLAAGISAPALDELESHLREEIDERKKAGASDIEAFNAGIQEIGRGEILTREFDKADATDVMESVKDSLVQIIGWLAAAGILLFGVVQFFGWCPLRYKDPDAGLHFLCAISEIFVAQAGFWLLAKANRDTVSRIVSFLVCLFMGWIGAAHDLWHSTPLWLCWSIVLLFLIPGIFWISRRWPLSRKKQQPITPAILTAERVFSVIAALYIIFNSAWFFHTELGARYALSPPTAMRWVIQAAHLLEFLLVIYAGCLAYTRIDKMRRARSFVE